MLKNFDWYKFLANTEVPVRNGQRPDGHII